jgi:hypothetical protein
VQKQAFTQKRALPLVGEQPHIGSAAPQSLALEQLRWQVQVPIGPGPPHAQVKFCGQSPGTSTRQVIGPASTPPPPVPVVPPTPLPPMPVEPPALLPAAPELPPSAAGVTDPHDSAVIVPSATTAIERTRILDADGELIPSSYARL